VDFRNRDSCTFRHQPFGIRATQPKATAGDDNYAVLVAAHLEDRASGSRLPSGYVGSSGLEAPSMVRNDTSRSPSLRTPRQMPAGIQIRSRGPSFRSISRLPSDQMHVSFPSRTKNSSSTSECKCNGPSWPGGRIIVLSVKCPALMILGSSCRPVPPPPTYRIWARPYLGFTLV